MIIVMKPGSTKQQTDHVINLVREMGLKDHPIVGTELTVIAVIGNDRNKDISVFETVDGVEKVMRVLAPYKMASKESKKTAASSPFAAAGRRRSAGRKSGSSPGLAVLRAKIS